MCGIVGAIARRNVADILLEGLKRLEYRGYDSAGMSLIDGPDGEIATIKTVGKVARLAAAAGDTGASGRLGIAHTRWATHGKITRANAHPHESGGRLSLVHNGIIENHEELRWQLLAGGYEFTTDTDTEVIAHLVHQELSGDEGAGLLNAVSRALGKLRGAYGLCVIDRRQPDRIVAARNGMSLVVGAGIGENFVASDTPALGQVTDRFLYLEDGDLAELTSDSIRIVNQGRDVAREIATLSGKVSDMDKGKYQHFMQKEIFEQPRAIRDTLSGRVSGERALEEAFGVDAGEIFDQVRQVQIVACGTSFHAGLIAKYWLESIARMPCQVDIASDYRYRDIIVQPGTLFVAVSQSGETADTLAALRYANGLEHTATLAICNVATSSLVRESDFCVLTMAGQEIGVASTKAFTTQLTLLLVLAIVLGRRNGLSSEDEARLVRDMNRLPALMEKTLGLDRQIRKLSRQFSDKHHSLYLGRGIQYPVAKEGALKLKEISYIHAEAYPAGELKHGPLALVDSDMPVIVVAPNNDLLDKLRSNLSEVSARGGKLYVFADESIGLENDRDHKVIKLPGCPEVLDPILFTIPLQLLSYHVAVIKGTDIDHPRNLAKSVTVE